MDFLTRIRSKSPIVRAQYALGIAGLLTGIIMVIWLSTLPARFSEIGAHATTTTNEKQNDVEEKGAARAPIEAQELGSLQIHEEATSTATTSSTIQGTTSTSTTTSSASRVIQIGTTSQNTR